MRILFSGGGYYQLINTLKSEGHVVSGFPWTKFDRNRKLWDEFNKTLLRKKIKNFKPDIFICAKGFRNNYFIYPDTLSWIKKNVGISIYWSLDDPFVVNSFIDSNSYIGYKIALSCSTQTFSKYRKVGMDPYLFWPAWDSLINKTPPNVKKKLDFILVGTPYACTNIPRRLVALWAMRQGMNFAIYGPKSWIEDKVIVDKSGKPFVQGDARLEPYYKGYFRNWRKLPELLSSAKLNFSNHVLKAKMYLNDRVFLVMGPGNALIMDCNPGIESVFKHNVEVMFYKNFRTFEHRAKYLLDHDNYRKEIGKNARRKILEEHTYKNRAIQLLDILKKYGFKK